MNALTPGFNAARSRQEVVELIALIGQGRQELEQIHAAEEAAITAAKSVAEAKAAPIKAAVADAQSKVEDWFKVHPEAAGGIPGAEAFVLSTQTQLAAVVLASGRPMTERQRTILERLKAGYVLRRKGKLRSYSLISPEPPHISTMFVSSSQVFDLQVRFLDGFDPITGALLPTATAYGARAVEFRIKPDVVIP